MKTNLSTCEKFYILMEILKECLYEDVIEDSSFYWILSFYRHKYGIRLGVDERKKLGI